MPNEKLLRALGLCSKAGALIFGTDAVCESFCTNKSPLLVVSASDCSENTAKKLRDKSSFYQIPVIVIDVDGETLAHAVGKTAKIACVAITDRNLSLLVKNSVGESVT